MTRDPRTDPRPGDVVKHSQFTYWPYGKSLGDEDFLRMFGQTKYEFINEIQRGDDE